MIAAPFVYTAIFALTTGAEALLDLPGAVFAIPAVLSLMALVLLLARKPATKGFLMNLSSLARARRSRPSGPRCPDRRGKIRVDVSGAGAAYRRARRDAYRRPRSRTCAGRLPHRRLERRAHRRDDVPRRWPGGRSRAGRRGDRGHRRARGRAEPRPRRAGCRAARGDGQCRGRCAGRARSGGTGTAPRGWCIQWLTAISRRWCRNWWTGRGRPGSRSRRPARARNTCPNTTPSPPTMSGRITACRQRPPPRPG